MNYFFHPEAEEEFLKAIDYYEDCRKGLGFDFAREIYSAMERIISFPSAWPEVDTEIHRCLVRRFPYGILYESISSEIRVLAVMHLHRSPTYWKHRAKSKPDIKI